MSLAWETVLQNDNHETARLKVFGGWVVRCKIGNNPPALSMVFIADEAHAWVPEETEGSTGNV